MIWWTVALSPPVRATSKASGCHSPQVRDRAKRVWDERGRLARWTREGPLRAGIRLMVETLGRGSIPCCWRWKRMVMPPAPGPRAVSSACRAATAASASGP